MRPGNASRNAGAAPDVWISNALERWVTAVARAPRLVSVVFLVAGLVAAVGAARSLGLDTDEDAMFSEQVSYAAKRIEFETAFPSLVDPIIILLEGRDAAQVESAARALRARLLEEPDHFLAVHDPEARAFFARYGLLYLEPDELQLTADRLIEAQPLLGYYARDPSLRGVAELLGRALSSDTPPAGFERILSALADSLDALHAGVIRPPDWDVQFGLPATAQPAQRYLLVRPEVDHGLLEPAGAALSALRDALAELGLDNAAPGAVHARVTGLYPLSSEEAHLLNHQVRLAGLASLLLVSCVLLAGLRSVRQALSLVCTLLVGLALTAGFATIAVGRLNLITVAFSVLFIGLSVDFGIHLLMRYRELLGTGLAPVAALGGAARTTGTALVICTATTAAAFFAFIPSDFVGVSELGLICGVSMFVGLLTNLTLLPALLGVAGNMPAANDYTWQAGKLRLGTAPGRYRRPVIVAALVAATGAAAMLPAVRFDHNPLSLRDSATESVQVFDELLRSGNAFPWNLNVLAASPEAARALSAELEGQSSVARALTLHDLVPAAQEPKLDVIEQLDLFLGPALTVPTTRTPPTAEESYQAMQHLAATAVATPHPQLQAPAARLATRLNALLARTDRDAVLADLNTVLATPLTRRIERLQEALQAGPVTLATLRAEPELAAQRIAADGRMRIEIFPAQDLNDNDALERFVREVQAITPQAFGESLVIYESGRIVVESFLRALLLASVAIILLLTLVWRNPRDVLLVLLPLAFAALLTATLSTLIGLSFNFANVIVIPLLLGMGVDSGIHLVHRRSHEAGAHPMLQTSTARAVVLSALTTLASFGTLAFTSHPGMASLGQLLVLGITLMLLSNLVLLPCLAEAAPRPPPGSS